MGAIARGLAEQVLNALRPVSIPEVPEGARINVHATVSRFAVLYERIRNAVDYKDEHLLRRSAIKRILRRQLILEHEPTVIADNVIRELIGARYLQNNELSETLITDAAFRIQKYQAVARTRIGSESHLDWLRSLLAVELEELFVDASRDKALVTFLYERLADRINIVNTALSDQDVRLQVYIACYRTLLKADNDVLGFKLLRAYMPEWLRPQEWIEHPSDVAERLIGIQRRIKQSLVNPLSLKFKRVVKPWAVAMNVLKDSLLEKPEDALLLLEKQESLNAMISRITQRRYAEIKGRIRRGAVRATFYLFITKMLVAFLVEVPLEQLWYGAVDRFTLTINVLFPPVLMVLVSLFIHIPGKDNTQRIQSNAMSLLASESLPMREIRAPRKRRGSSGFLFGLAYLLMFVVTFGLVGLLLVALNFTWLSAAIFYFFLCVVSFFAFRLRQNALEYVVVEGRDRFYTVVFDFLSLPILRAGQWLSGTISKLNVFMFILDFIIEAPFKIFLGVLEEWFGFLKEKKEELQ